MSCMHTPTENMWAVHLLHVKLQGEFLLFYFFILVSWLKYACNEEFKEASLVTFRSRQVLGKCHLMCRDSRFD